MTPRRLIADPHAAGIAMVLTATLGLAFKGILARLAFSTGLDVPGVLLWRMALAVPAFWLAAGMFLRASPVMFELKAWARSIGPAVLFAAATVADFHAIALAGAGVSRMVLFTFPLIVVLIVAGRDRAAPPGRQVAAFAIAYAGLAAVVAPGLDGGIPGLVDGPGFVVGLAWSAVSAVTYAGYLVFSQPLIRDIGAIRFTVQANTVSAALVVAWVAIAAPGTDLAITAEGARWMGLMAVFSTVLPILLLLAGMKTLGPGRGSLLTMSGPAITVLAAWAILGERFSPGQIAGIAVVFLGMAVLEGRVPGLRRRARA